MSDSPDEKSPTPTGGQGKGGASVFGIGLLPAALLVAVVLVLGAILGVLAYRTYLDRKDEPSPALAADAPQPGAGVPEKWRPDPGGRYPAQFAATQMFPPRFDPARRDYVVRCVPGKVKVQVRARPGTRVEVEGYPAKTGRFFAEARVLPGQDFSVRVTGRGEADNYRVRCLPDDFPRWSYRQFRRPPKGSFLVSMRPKPTNENRNWMIVFDQDGVPVWWYSPLTNTLGGQVLADGTVQTARGFGDGFGQDARAINEIRTLDGRLVKTVGTKGTPTDGHEYIRLPNGNALVMSYSPRLGADLSVLPIEGRVDRDKDASLDGEIQEVTPSGKVVWRWNSSDHIPLSEIPPRWRGRIARNPHPDPQGNRRYDTFHLNSIEPWRNQLVISTRHTDKVYGISRKTGEVLWTFGGTRTPKSLKIKGDDPHADYPIGGQHDARITDGNILSVHDNGTHLGRPPRVVRYRLDLENRTATFVSEVTDEKAAPDSHCCGGSRPFGDGWLVAWGNNPVVSGFDSRDELAFRLTLPVPPYRAVPVPDSVSLKALGRGLEKMEMGPQPPATGVKPIEFYGTG